MMGAVLEPPRLAAQQVLRGPFGPMGLETWKLDCGSLGEHASSTAARGRGHASNSRSHTFNLEMNMSTTIRVTMVEDDPGLQESIQKYVNSAPGFRCIGVCANAEAALANIPGNPPDVVLMDIKLPTMSGIECARLLKTAVPTVQILMLTVFEDTELIFNALEAGASGYLLKRFPPPKLLDAIREVYQGGSPMSAPIARKVVESFQRPPTASKPSSVLSQREREVLESLAKGLTYKQIAHEKSISIDTIRTYVRRIYEKLHVQSRTEAVAKYMAR